MPSAYCPNCSAPLAAMDVPACGNCDATFTHKDGWRPIDHQVGTYVPRPKPVKAEKDNEEPEPDPMPVGERVVRVVFAVPLLLCAPLLLFLGMSQLGALAALPGLLCLVSGIGVLVSRTPVATVLSAGTGGLLYLLVFAALKFVGAASFSR